MKLIPLTQGQVAKVCDCHAHLVEGYKWRAQWMKECNSYRAVRWSTRKDQPRKQMFMHAAINSTPKGFHTDHKNHDTLDNQCSNLRTATPSQNGANRAKLKNNKSGYKGVIWIKKWRRWQAQITVDGKINYLGYHTTPEAAALAYNKAALEKFGEFSYLNVVTSGQVRGMQA
jgi:hypothetical protein